MKRSLLCLFLVLCLALCACTSNTANPAVDASPNGAEPDSAAAIPGKNYADAELARAVTLGIGEYKDGDPAVTYAEFFKMLDRTVELADPAKLAEWQNMLPDARKSSRAILRCEAMLALCFAAETLGPEYVGYNDSGRYIMPIISNLYPGDETFGMSVNMNAGNYDLFPNADENTKYQDNFYIAAAYYMGIGRLSLATYKPIIELDANTNSFRSSDILTHTEALLTALRLYESVLPPESTRVLTELDREILEKADVRREAIRNSPTEVTVTGKKYYVSNDGNDKNDGLSPEKPWATLNKVHNFKFRPGDGVFFKRGDLWRYQGFDAQEGVTYSAYGEGEKPRFYGSPENGAGEEKWSLVPGTGNVWVFYKDMRDCGAIVFNEGESYAQKEYLYWDGSNYRTFTSYDSHSNVLGNDAFKPSDLKNLRFYNDIDYGEITIKWPTGDGDYYLMASEYNYLGKLYLRCEEGNPGLVYESVEFCTDRSDTNGFMIGVYTTGVTIDNLCLKYAAHGITLGMPTTMQYDTKNFSKGNQNTVQNCEIGWAAGTTERFRETGLTIYSGDVMHIEGDNNMVINNYMYESQDNGIPIEVSCTYLDFGDDWRQMEVTWENLTIKGNLVERCYNGIYLQNWETPEIPNHMLHNIVIEDNYVLYSGYGHSTKRDHELWDIQSCGRAQIGYEWGTALQFMGPDYFPNANDGIYVRDNIFYLSTSVLINSGMPEKYYPKFSGNTYVQNNYGRFAYWREPDGREVLVNIARPDIQEYVKDQLGDDTATIAPVSTGVPTS